MLHLDRNEYYGEDSASFSFTQLLDWANDHANGNTNTNTSTGINNTNLAAAAAKSPAGSSITGACSKYDAETVGLAIARGHARNEMKKEREAAEKVSSTGSTGNSEGNGTGEDEPLRGQEINSSNGVNTGANEASKSHSISAAPPVPPSDADTADNKPITNSGEGSSSPAAPAITETTTTPAPLLTASATGKEEKGTKKGKARNEQEEEQQKKNEDNLLIEKAAASRFKSMNLHFLPLDYHGCSTKATTPSDTCVLERAEQKAAEEAAAAAGRFRRQPEPSHPAWLGRTASKKKAEGAGNGGVGGGEEAFTHPSFWGFRTDRAPGAADLVRLSRSFNLDLTSQVNT